MDWDNVIIAIIGAPAAIILAYSSYVTARSLGRVNGEGSVQQQLKKIRHKQNQIDETVWATQAIAHNVRDQLIRHEEWQNQHSIDDAEGFAAIGESVDKIKTHLERQEFE